MKKSLVGALVGAIILFIWQFISWGISGIHGAEMQYTENQDEILAFLDGKLEEGTYFLPTVPEGASQEEQQALAETATGKPWAKISYRASFNSNMGMNLVRGFATDLIAAFLLCWVLLQFANLTFDKAIIASLSIGLIGYLTISYLNSIWFENNSLGDLIDAIVSWVLVGAWLGWWLRR